MARQVVFPGQTYGRLRVVAEIGRLREERLFHCLCQCGTTVDVVGSKLRSGHTQSCGCLKQEVAAATAKCHVPGLKHGHTLLYGGKSPTYTSWQKMLDRCRNPNVPEWRYYGAKGVTVCARWDPQRGGGFENFLADMGPRPSWADGGIDRIDVRGSYEPSNCQWATRSQQATNRRGKEK